MPLKAKLTVHWTSTLRTYRTFKITGTYTGSTGLQSVTSLRGCENRALGEHHPTFRTAFVFRAFDNVMVKWKSILVFEMPINTHPGHRVMCKRN